MVIILRGSIEGFIQEQVLLIAVVKDQRLAFGYTVATTIATKVDSWRSIVEVIIGTVEVVDAITLAKCLEMYCSIRIEREENKIRKNLVCLIQNIECKFQFFLVLKRKGKRGRNKS